LAEAASTQASAQRLALCGGFAVNIIDVMNDEEAFAPWFEGPSWDPWRVILRAAYCLPMTPYELEVFTELAGGRSPPSRRVRELFVVGGRRGGKDSIASLLAVFAATLEEGHRGRLRPGEKALVQLLAVDRDQSKIVLGYIRSYFDENLQAMIVRETRDGFDLNNDVSISITTNSFRQVRGQTVVLSIFDECAFWKDETSVKPDVETYRAVKPSLATLPGSMMVAISSPYRKSGLLYDKWRAHFGKGSDDVLVIQATSLQLNPTLDPSIIEQALDDDPAAARAEWLGEWRNDIASYVDVELIESAVDRGVLVRPPQAGVHYVAFVDAASGVGQDSFACAVGHEDGHEIIIDVVHEIRPPFNPQSAIAEVVQLIRSYGIREVSSDRYAPGFVNEAFERNGVRHLYAEHDRSQLYVECLPLLASGRVRLVDNRKLVAQFASLERRTRPGGKDRVDHGVSGHDDLSNSVAGVLQLVAGGRREMVISDEAIAQIRRMRPRDLGWH
jgi:hypothetical protein